VLQTWALRPAMCLFNIIVTCLLQAGHGQQDWRVLEATATCQRVLQQVRLAACTCCTVMVTFYHSATKCMAPSTASSASGCCHCCVCMKAAVQLEKGTAAVLGELCAKMFSLDPRLACYPSNASQHSCIVHHKDWMLLCLTCCLLQDEGAAKLPGSIWRRQQ
jgi:hypothetical protein